MPDKVRLQKYELKKSTVIFRTQTNMLPKTEPDFCKEFEGISSCQLTVSQISPSLQKDGLLIGLVLVSIGTNQENTSICLVRINNINDKSSKTIFGSGSRTSPDR